MPLLEFYCTIGICLLGIFAIIHSLSLPVMGPVALSPAMFPLIIGLLLVLLGTIQLVQLFKQYGFIWGRSKHFSEETKIDQIEKSREGLNLIIIIALLLIYLYVLPLIHFIPSTLIFLIILMSYIHHKISLKIIVISLIVTLSLFYSFSKLFKLILP